MNDYKLEVRRKIFHILTGIIIALLLSFGLINAWTIFIILIAGIILSLFQQKVNLPIITWFIRYFERKGERPGKGAITFMLGTLLAVKLFPTDIAIASILILAIGDGMSTILGPHGKIKGFSDKKLLEGTLGGAFFGFIAALFVLNWFEAALASMIAMIAEAVELRIKDEIVDDNIIVPLVAGSTVLLLRLAL